MPRPKHRQFAGHANGRRIEIDRILSLEYAHTHDVVARIFGVPLAGILISVYTESMMATYWCLFYVATYVGLWLYAKSLGPQVSLVQCRITYGFVILNAVSYIWLPAWTFSQFDRNLFLVGAGLIGAQLVLLVHRGDTSPFQIYGNISVVFLGMLILF